MTTPTHTMPATRPVAARWPAACGSSKDPGTQCTSIASGPSRAARRAPSAPATSRCVMRSLKRAAMIANLMGPALRAARRSFGSRGAISVRQGRQQVPGLVALGAGVLPVGLGRRNLDRYALRDVQTVALEDNDLLRVVGQELEILDPEVDEDLGADAVAARAAVKPERGVGLDRVLAQILELVGPHLVEEPDPPPLLPHVHENAPPLGLDAGERLVELEAAVAPARVEHVAGEALGVHTNEHGIVAGYRAHHQRERHAAVDRRVVRDRAELAELGGELGRRYPPDQLFLEDPVLDEVADRDHLEAVLTAQLVELRHPRHVAVLVEHLADDAGRVAAGEAGEVDGGLRVARASQDPPGHRAQRAEVAGTGEGAAGERRPGSSRRGGRGRWRPPCGPRVSGPRRASRAAAGCARDGSGRRRASAGRRA